MLDKEIQAEIIQKNREFLKGYRENDPYMEDFESDQDLKLPQPPLVKAPMGGAKISLTKSFDGLPLINDCISLFRNRRSVRVFDQAPLTLEQLSFLLWATQGVKGIRGRSYATLRTVRSGGARHPFETYLLVQNVEGLRPGAYHYLPMEHALEFLHPVEDLPAAISESLCGQGWAAKAGVVFYWAMVAYRAEWRYGIYAHSPSLIDVGHVGQNLYLACTSLGLGTCGIAAFMHETCCRIFGLDGEEEFVVYTAPVGTVRPNSQKEEQAFYQFVEEDNL